LKNIIKNIKIAICRWIKNKFKIANKTYKKYFPVKSVYNDIQIEIINYISNGDIYNIETFQKTYWDDIDGIRKNGSVEFSDKQIHIDGYEILIPCKNTKPEQLLKEFLIIWNMLEQKNLITTITQATEYPFPKTFFTNNLYDNTKKE